ncbi:hypothetical protein D3C81_725440 [compost metagenome]
MAILICGAPAGSGPLFVSDLSHCRLDLRQVELSTAAGVPTSLQPLASVGGLTAAEVKAAANLAAAEIQAGKNLPGVAKILGGGNTSAVGADTTAAVFDGALYPADKLKQLVPYLEKRGVNVYGTTGNPRFDAKWDGTGTMYLPENPTALQVKHELSHYLDFKEKLNAADDIRSGVQSFVDMGRVGREEAVLNRLQNNRIWETLNSAEKNFSIEYVNRLKKEQGK